MCMVSPVDIYGNIPLHYQSCLISILGMVSPVQISRVTDITKFIKAICTSQPEATDGLTDVISLLYSVVQR